MALLVKTEVEEAVSAIACCGFTTGREGLALRVAYGARRLRDATKAVGACVGI